MKERFEAGIRPLGRGVYVLVWDTKFGTRVWWLAGKPTRLKLWRARRYARSLNRAVNAGHFRRTPRSSGGLTRPLADANKEVWRKYAESLESASAG